MAKKQYQRNWKNYLIRKEIQLRMVLTNLIYMLLIVSVTFAILLSPLINDMISSDNIQIQYNAAQTFLTLLKRLLPALFVMFILIFFHQISFTHRICGPLVNFDHTFRKISQGDLTRKITLRKGDYLGRECERINEMIESLGRLISTILTDADKLVDILEKTVAHVDDIDTRAKLQDALSSVKHEALLVKEDLSLFKTGSSKSE